MINRGVLIVRPQQPFLDWAAGLDASGVLPDPAGEQTVYLVPDFDDDQEAQTFIAKAYRAIFENELAGWHTDESAWPAKRDLKTFRKWFAIELHSVVEDLCDSAIVDDND